MQAGGGEADDRVAGLHGRAVDDLVQGDGAEAGAGDVDAADHLAELGQLAAGDLDPGQFRAAGEADADFGADRRVGAVDRDVVEHRQRLGADADHVVDVHRHAVDPDRVEAPQLLGDQQLGPDAVGRERDPGALVELDHAGVVAGQRHLPRGPPELDRPERLDQPGDRGVRGSLVHSGLGVGVAAHAVDSFRRSPPDRELARRCSRDLCSGVRSRPRSLRSREIGARRLVGDPVAGRRGCRTCRPRPGCRTASVSSASCRWLSPSSLLEQSLDLAHLGDLALDVDVVLVECLFDHLELVDQEVGRVAFVGLRLDEGPAVLGGRFSNDRRDRQVLDQPVAASRISQKKRIRAVRPLPSSNGWS